MPLIHSGDPDFMVLDGDLDSTDPDGDQDSGDVAVAGAWASAVAGEWASAVAGAWDMEWASAHLDTPSFMEEAFITHTIFTVIVTITFAKTLHIIPEGEMQHPITRIEITEMPEVVTLLEMPVIWIPEEGILPTQEVLEI